MDELMLNNSDTMTHLQLAELTSKRPDNVKRTMDDLGSKGLIVVTQSEGRVRGKGVTEYHVNERDSYVVVARLSPEFTAFLVDEWQKRKSQPKLTQEQQVLAIAHQLIETTKQRDDAIATKAQINDSRTATIMGRLGNAKKRINKLEKKLQDEGTHKTTLAANLPVTIAISGKNRQVATILRNISEDMELPRQKVPCKRYGEVWAYHVNVIEQFREMYLK